MSTDRERLEARTHDALAWTWRTHHHVIAQSSWSLPAIVCYTKLRMRMLRNLLAHESVLDVHVVYQLKELQANLENTGQLARERGGLVCWLAADMQQEADLLAQYLSGRAPEGPEFDDPDDPELKKALKEIAKLAQLEPGWNSYRARPIGTSAREKAIQFLAKLRRERRDLPLPIIGPSPDGGVAFQWRDKQHEVEIIFLPNANEYSVAKRGEEEYLLEGERADPEFLVKDIVGKFVLAR